MATVPAHGTTVTYQSGLLTQITGIDFGGMERESIPTSTFSTTDMKTFTPSELTDPGEWTVTGYLDPDDLGPQGTAGFSKAMIADAETVTITFNNSGGVSGTTFAASGFATSFAFTGELEGIWEYTMGIKLTGAVTLTDAT